MDRLSQVITLDCPSCRKPLEYPLRWFYRQSTCSHCRADLNQVLYPLLSAIQDRFDDPRDHLRLA
ncbi:MAG TPA: hypothetical protein VHE37_13440 [Nevskiaceae bacterium]|nr:hypothetical protein [Nevskiaceae bacterium]